MSLVSKIFRAACHLAVVSFVASSCMGGNIALAQSNSSAPVLTEDAIRAMSRDEAMATLLSMYKPQIDGLVHVVKAHVPPKYRQRAAGWRVNYLRDETPFSFYKDSDDHNTINVCLGGVNALDISSSALGASLFVLRDPTWWVRYLLYHRELRRRPGTVWVDPLDAAGMTQENVEPDQSLAMAVFAHETLGDMLAFVVAHEVGHAALEHDGYQRDNESTVRYGKRMRQQEEAADAFALDVISSMDVDPFAVVTTLLTHLIIFEDAATVASSKHPPDHARIRRVIKFYERQNLPQHRKFLTVARDLTRALKAYDELDAAAQSITLESLKQHDAADGND